MRPLERREIGPRSRDAISRLGTRPPCHRVKKIDVHLRRAKTISSPVCFVFIYLVLLKRIPEGNDPKILYKYVIFLVKTSLNLSNVANWQNEVTFALSMNLFRIMYQLHHRAHCKIVHVLKYSSDKYKGFPGWLLNRVRLGKRLIIEMFLDLE